MDTCTSDCTLNILEKAPLDYWEMALEKFVIIIIIIIIIINYHYY